MAAGDGAPSTSSASDGDAAGRGDAGTGGAPAARSSLLFTVLHGCRDAMGRSAVHIAASNGDAELIAHVVEFGGGKPARRPAGGGGGGEGGGEGGDPPGDRESADSPARDRRRGMLVNARDLHGLTPLEYAAWRGRTNAIDMLLQYRCARARAVDGRSRPSAAGRAEGAPPEQTSGADRLGLLSAAAVVVGSPAVCPRWRRR